MRSLGRPQLTRGRTANEAGRLLQRKCGCGGACDECGKKRSAKQYSNITSLYLRSALIAGEFPEITTHFVLDRGIGDHCDPRCFNLDFLYESIRTGIGHPAPARYGVQPLYDTKAPATVWWHEPVCGGKHP